MNQGDKLENVKVINYGEVREFKTNSGRTLYYHNCTVEYNGRQTTVQISSTKSTHPVKIGDTQHFTVKKVNAHGVIIGIDWDHPDNKSNKSGGGRNSYSSKFSPKNVILSVKSISSSHAIKTLELFIGGESKEILHNVAIVAAIYAEWIGENKGKSYDECQMRWHAVEQSIQFTSLTGKQVQYNSLKYQETATHIVERAKAILKQTEDIKIDYEETGNSDMGTNSGQSNNQQQTGRPGENQSQSTTSTQGQPEEPNDDLPF